MNTSTDAEYEYRVMVNSGLPAIGWYNPYGTRAYPSLGTARGLKTHQERWYPEVRIERRPVVQEWEVVE